jgi:thioredoxin-dependent peroxiredoxin
MHHWWIAACLLGFCAARASGLEIGQPAPDFTAPGDDGEPVRLSDYRGQWVVLYFYPKADTPGCTKQGCSLRDGYAALRSLDAVVLGVSLDSVEKQKAFKEKYNLPFTLVSDSDKKIAKAYDVLAGLGLFAARKTFLIDPAGNLAAVLDQIDVRAHDEQVAEALKTLQSKS